jgi:transposase InsO family protein
LSTLVDLCESSEEGTWIQIPEISPAKKLGRIRGVGHRFGPRSHRNRGIGWSYAHVAVDDHSRLAYVEELPDEHPLTTVGFLERALAFYGAHGIDVRRILTDNGGCYRSRLFLDALAARAIAERKTKPYHPQTNGKAEAMVKILINSWAYARPYASTSERRAALPGFVEFYNLERPHGGLNGARPIDRVRQ